jgi:hypothetical protein
MDYMPGFYMSALLKVVERPEFFSGGIIALVEQRVESCDDERLVTRFNFGPQPRTSSGLVLSSVFAEPSLRRSLAGRKYTPHSCPVPQFR